jgi:hypothetical protein
MQRSDNIIAWRERIIRVGLKRNDLVAIEPIETVRSSKPEEALLVLGYSCHGGLSKPILNGKRMDMRQRITIVSNLSHDCLSVEIVLMKKADERYDSFEQPMRWHALVPPSE